MARSLPPTSLVGVSLLVAVAVALVGAVAFTRLSRADRVSQPIGHYPFEERAGEATFNALDRNRPAALRGGAT